MKLLLTALAGFAAAAALTPFVRAIALQLGIVDTPTLPRKLHKKPTPLLGGVALVVALTLTIIFAVTMGWLPGEYIKTRSLVGLGAALVLLALGGALDDRYDLKPSRQIIWPIAAALVAIWSGIGTEVVTNPFGGLIHLGFLAPVFAFIWLLGMTYTTKFFDGLDGLVAGVTGIGALVIAAVSLMVEVSQPDTAVLAVALAGVCAGFLIYNFFPATIFLGEGGSTVCGFLLGALAIVSGGKIATTLLVLGLPILDAVVVIARRVLNGRPIASGDRSHLHFRLLELGLTQRQAVLFLYFMAAFFGASTLVLRGSQKIAALALAACVLVVIIAGSMAVVRRKKI
jgi:UDP-GlcNAc:undecaprenyl-phosphate GlcNAc-1-phosphate transferase